MTKLMKLSCMISLSETPGMFRATSEMVDGTPFSVKVQPQDLIFNDQLTENRTTVDGWLFVEHVGEQNSKAAITLPAPSLEHGRNVVVSALKLMPRHVTIEMFHPGLKQQAAANG